MEAAPIVVELQSPVGTVFLRREHTSPVQALRTQRTWAKACERQGLVIVHRAGKEMPYHELLALAAKS